MVLPISHPPASSTSATLIIFVQLFLLIKTVEGFQQLWTTIYRMISSGLTSLTVVRSNTDNGRCCSLVMDRPLSNKSQTRAECLCVGGSLKGRISADALLPSSPSNAGLLNSSPQVPRGQRLGGRRGQRDLSRRLHFDRKIDVRH